MAGRQMPSTAHEDMLEYMPLLFTAKKVHGWQAKSSAAVPSDPIFLMPLIRLPQGYMAGGRMHRETRSGSYALLGALLCASGPPGLQA